jgi:hypothetical protein
VDLDLVYRRYHRRPFEQGREVLDHEVADPDRADPAVSQQRLQGLVGRYGAVELRGQRLVQDQQVDLIDPELAGALLEPVQRLGVSVIADPNLGLQEHLRPVETRGVDRLTDLAFVAVRGGGVDVPVPGVQCGPHGITCFVWGCLEDRPSAGISTPLLRVIVPSWFSFSGCAAVRGGRGP